MDTHAPLERPDAISGIQSKQKHCLFCGQFFKSDPRVGDRQVACANSACRRRRKQAAQHDWVRRNPDYFRGRSAETRAWRLKNPGYQKAWRARRRLEIQDEMPGNSSIITMHLAITDKDLRVEIQDEIRRQKVMGYGFLVVGRPREIQDEIALQTPLEHRPP